MPLPTNASTEDDLGCDDSRTFSQFPPLDRSKNQTRLVHLASGSDLETENGSTICCTLSVVSLDDEPNYEALSYAWGSSCDRVSITLNGSSFPVSQNLYSALTYLRPAVGERVLWIDALCINQDDNNERTHQVQLMQGIYSGAESVIAWLGEPWDYSNAAFDLFDLLSKKPHLHIDPTVGESIGMNGIDLESSEVRNSIKTFFLVPWWQRIWTVQESILSKELYYMSGRHIVHDSRVKVWAAFISQHLSCCDGVWSETVGKEAIQGHRTIVSVMVDAGRLRAYKQDFLSRNFLSTLSAFRHRLSTDPRDKLYGLLALASGPEKAIVEPRYTMSATEVYKSAAMELIKVNRNLDVFSHIHGKRNLEVPSYVPDWSVPWPETFWSRASMLAIHRRSTVYIELYAASKTTTAQLTDVGYGKIRIRGVGFDTIATIVKPLRHSLLDSYISWKNVLSPMIDQKTEYPHTKELYETALWKAVCGGSGQGDNTIRIVDERADFPKFNQWYEFMNGRRRIDSDLVKVHDSVCATVKERNFFITERGYIGFGPDDSAKGDVVAVLAGGKVPYVLQPVELPSTSAASETYSDACYRLLGDSYVHGIMYGEAFDLLNVDEANLPSLVLV